MGALTLPDYFEIRFNDRTRLLRIAAHPHRLVGYGDDGCRLPDHWDATGVPGTGRIDRAIMRTVSAGTSPIAVTTWPDTRVV